MNILARLRSEVFAVEPSFAQESLRGLEKIQQDRANGVTHEAIANDSVTYQTIGKIAVIAVDGVMYKKNVGGMCSSVVSYDQIVSKIDMAEQDGNVDTILFRIDTNGGSVAGADEVRNKITNSSKKTILYAENLLASAGLWVFSEADEIYSSDVTQIGSIGVIVMYENTEKKINTIVSSNAENKHCDIADEKCKSKIQKKLDIYESKFYKRLEMSFGKDRETIKSDFNSGDTIFANEAHEKGYVKEIIEFDCLLRNLSANGSAMPLEKIVNSMQGAEMHKDETLPVETIKGEQVDLVALEQTRMKEVLDVVVAAKMTDNTEIMTMVTDGKSSATDVKAKMFDMVQSKEKEIIAQLQDDGIAAQVDNVDGASKPPRQEDLEAKEGDAYLSFAEENKGSVS